MRDLKLFLIALTFLGTSGPVWATGGIDWRPCPPPPEGHPETPLECATVAVPLDYRSPAGRTIDIAISRAATARPELRRGVLLFNPGGPGGPGLDLPRAFAVLLPPEVRDRFDLIGFDPRFIGQSTPLTCGLTEKQTNEAFPPIMQPGGFNETVSFVQEVAAACGRTAGDLLPFVTTANTARDMDRIREALGETKISYLGYSYGTYLGAVYASLFPERTDRVVLDSAVNPYFVWRDVFRAFGLGGDTRFPDFATFVAAHDETYQLGSTPAEIRALYFRLFSQLEADPLPLESIGSLDGHWFQALTFGNLYNDFSFPFLAQLFQALNQEVLTPQSAQRLFRQLLPARAHAQTVPADNFTAGGLAIICGDVGWSPSIELYRRELTFDRHLFPMFGELGSNIYPCAFWPATPIEPPVPISSEGRSNILIVQGLRDPATPYLPAQGMRHALGQRSRFLTVDQGGHGIYLSTFNSCANNLTSTFLSEGTLPPDDPFCGPEAPPPPTVSAKSTARDRALAVLRRAIR